MKYFDSLAAIALGTIFLACCPYSSAQSAAPSLQLARSFGCGSRTGEVPATTLIEAPDGRMYGTTQTGGEKYGGTIFSFALDPKLGDRHEFITHYSLDPVRDGDRIMDMFLASDGKFYGVTCGSQKQGIFQYTPGQPAPLTYLWSGGGDSGCPTGLVEGSDGNLYGTLYYGGTLGWGAVFELAKSVNAAPVALANFGGSIGQTLNAGLVEASDGNLYGMTYTGGDQHETDPNGYGVIYRLNLAAKLQTPSIVHIFELASGAYGAALLKQGPNQNLYGAATAGGCAEPCTAWTAGVVFSQSLTSTPQPDGYTSLHWFGVNVNPAGALDGAVPNSGGLEFGPDGRLYGTTVDGGANDTGAAYSFPPSYIPDQYLVVGSFTAITGSTESSLAAHVAAVQHPVAGQGLLTRHAISGTGDYPVTGFTLAHDGSLYGVATGNLNGTPGDGSVVKVVVPNSAGRAAVKVTSTVSGGKVTLHWQVFNAYSNTDRLCSVAHRLKAAPAGIWTSDTNGTPVQVQYPVRRDTFFSWHI